jgi:hypothetical protein
MDDDQDDLLRKLGREPQTAQGIIEGLETIEAVVRNTREMLRSQDLTDDERVFLHGKLAELAASLDSLRSSLP